MSQQPQQSETKEDLKPSFYFFLISLVFLVFWIIFVGVIAYTEATGFTLETWKWYWYVLLVAVISFVLSVTMVLGKLWIIWISQKMKAKIENLKNKEISISEMKKKYMKELEDLRKIKKKMVLE